MLTEQDNLETIDAQDLTPGDVIPSHDGNRHVVSHVRCFDHVVRVTIDRGDDPYTVDFKYGHGVQVIA